MSQLLKSHLVSANPQLRKKMIHLMFHHTLENSMLLTPCNKLLLSKQTLQKDGRSWSTTQTATLLFLTSLTPPRKSLVFTLQNSSDLILMLKLGRVLSMDSTRKYGSAPSTSNKLYMVFRVTLLRIWMMPLKCTCILLSKNK